MKFLHSFFKPLRAFGAGRRQNTPPGPSAAIKQAHIRRTTDVRAEGIKQPDAFEYVWKSFMRLTRLFDLGAPYEITDREIDILNKRLRVLKIEWDKIREELMCDRVIKAATQEIDETEKRLAGRQ